MLVHWIWLAQMTGMSGVEKMELLRHFPDPETIYYSEINTLDYNGTFRPEARNALSDKDLSPAQGILDKCEEKQIRVLTYQDAAYPQRLKNIADPPVVLYYKGQLPDFDAYPVIAVVGTRNASPYGVTIARQMGQQIAQCGGIVVSGLAYGIDGSAMIGALAGKGKTVGILGCGVDIVYPLRNKELFADVERFGCIISEYPPGMQPAKWTFPKRNRIMSGIANGVLVVEAPEKSGALITASCAAEQGRDVFVVPGNIDQSGFVGSNRLLRDGAIMASCGWDVIGEYESLYPDKIVKADGAQQLPRKGTSVPKPKEKTQLKVAQPVKIPVPEKDLKKELDNKAIDKEPSTAYSDVNKSLPRLSKDEQAIVDALRSGQLPVDEVVRQTGISAGKLLATLTVLELKGVIRRLPGKILTLKKR